MPVSDICSKPLVLVERNASLQYAAQLMKKHQLGSVVVVEANGRNKPIGILTDRDIALKIVAENLSLETKVGKVMSTDLIKVPAVEGIAAVVDKMSAEGVRRIVIVDDAGSACGMVSSDDIIQLLAQEMNGLSDIVRKQSREDTESTNRIVMA